MIEPWNFPLAMLALDLVPALAAGAAVLLKPSEVTPLSAVELVRGWNEIGAPPILKLATGYGATGASVIENADYVHFTGSTATGRKVAVACAERLIPFSLELGGKDPPSCWPTPTSTAPPTASPGAGCSTPARFASRWSGSSSRPRSTTSSSPSSPRRFGRCSRARSSPGSATTPARWPPRQRDIVERHVNEAVASRGQGAHRRQTDRVGTFFEPTVLADVDPSMTCIAEETFGPTLPVIKVADEEEAIRLANDSQYGLSASVWTGSNERGTGWRRLEVGAVNINDALANVFCPGLPMGGWKDSASVTAAAAPPG